MTLPDSYFLVFYLSIYLKALLWYQINAVSRKCINGCQESSKTKFGVPIKDIGVW